MATFGSQATASHETPITVSTAALLAAFVVLVPSVTWANTGGDLNGPFILSAAITLYAGARLSFLSTDSRPKLLQLHFWLFVYCWLGIAASVQTAQHIFPWGDGDLQTDQNLLATDLVIIAGLTVYELSLTRRLRSAPTRTGLEFKLPTFGRYSVLTVLCCVATISAIALEGGVAAVTKSRGEVDRYFTLNLAEKSHRLIEQTIQHIPPVVALLVSLHLVRKGSFDKSRRALLYAAIAALLGLNSVANYLPSLNRITLGFIVTGGASLWLVGKPRHKRVYTPILVVGLLVVFPYADYFRTQNGYGASSIRGPMDTLVHKGDYDAFEMISNSVAMVDQRGWDYGDHILGSLLFFVPRAAWPSKPYGTGQAIGEILGYSMTNLSAPLWAEFYYSIGLPAILVGFWAFAGLTRRIENLLVQTQQAGALVIAYSAGFQIFILRGDLMNGIAYSLPGFLILGCYLISRREHARISGGLPC